MPSHGKRSRGRSRKTYIDQLAEDSGCRVEDLATVMIDREEWRERVSSKAELARLMTEGRNRKERVEAALSFPSTNIKQREFEEQRLSRGGC